VLHGEVRSDRPLASPTLESTITMPDGKQVPLSFTPDPSKAGRFQAEFEPANPGQYKIAAAVSTGGKVVADVLTAVDVEQPRGELTNTRIDSANLTRIASGTGGKVINPDDKSTWPTQLKLDRYEVEQPRHLDLWNNMTLLMILAALLGTDWLLRLL